MDAETPAEPVGFAADCGAVLRDLRDVIGAPVFRPSRSDTSTVFRLDEFDAFETLELLFGEPPRDFGVRRRSEIDRGAPVAEQVTSAAKWRASRYKSMPVGISPIGEPFRFC